MRWSHQIRHWKRVGCYSLLALAMHRIAVAETPTASVKPTQPSTVAPKKRAATSTSSKKTSAHSKSARSKKTSKKRGQQAIDPARSREIQTALIREHYLQGEPSGTWDAASQAAMQRYQADHGWQSKTTPDSRALIQLGLGPKPGHLLNPESAATSAPAGSKTASSQSPQQNNLSQQ
jgi:hypothetical protein